MTSFTHRHRDRTQHTRTLSISAHLYGLHPERGMLKRNNGKRREVRIHFFTFRPRKWFSSSGLQELHDPKKLGSMSFREWGSKIFLDLECSRIRSTAAGSIKSHPRQSLKDLSLTLLSSKIIERSFGIFTNPISPSLSQESPRTMGGNLTERGFKN